MKKAEAKSKVSPPSKSSGSGRKTKRASGIEGRKAEHLELASQESMQAGGHPFDRYRFEHNALPEIDLEQVDLSTEFLGRQLKAPLLLSCMTGGTAEAKDINSRLAEAAQECGVALGVGSQRAALEDESLVDTFQVRHLAPDVPLLANLGAVQLNLGYGAAECEKAIEMIEADALVLHLNPLQEALQPGGDHAFRNLLPKLSGLKRELNVPLVVKEVGSGISASVARRLHAVGVRWIDTAGVGGTSWARIEGARSENRAMGEIFADWGIETPESILQVSSVDGVRTIASGGLRTGLDVAKSLALGADMAGMAYPMLLPARESTEAVVEQIESVMATLKIAMFVLGVRRPGELKGVALHRDGQPFRQGGRQG